MEEHSYKLKNKQSVQFKIMRILRLILFFLCQTFALLAQEYGSPIIRNYTAKEYNNSPQIMTVLQDKRGVMYFGVDNGVMEYDGVSWRNILNKNRSSVTDLAMDNKGKIYVAAINDFGYLTTDEKENTIYKSLLFLIKDTTQKLGGVWSIRITSKFVYFRTYDAILQYSPASENVNIFKADTCGMFNTGFIYKDVYYTRLTKKGLMKIENNKLMPAFQSIFFKNKNKFNVAVPYNSTSFLVPTNSEGLYLYKPDIDSIPRSFTISNKDFIAENYINNISGFQNNYYILGSNEKGAVLFDKHGNTVQKYNEQNLLQANYICRIATDTTQNIWFGLDNGISKTESGIDLSYWDKNSGLKGGVSSIIRYAGLIYIATGSSVYYIDKQNQIRKVKSIPSGENWCFLQLKNRNSLLTGTEFGIYEIKEDKVIHIYKGGHAFKLFQTLKNPNRIISTDLENTISLKYENGKWISEGKWKGIKGQIVSISEDHTGDFWFATLANELIKVTPDYNNITQPKKIRYYTKKDGFASMYNITPYIFKNKVICGTAKGIYIYNAQADRFEPFCKFGNQFCNGSRDFYPFQEMPDGKLWISSSDRNIDFGYLQANKKGSYDWFYAPFRRIPEISYPVLYIEPTGIVWIGGSEGLYRYDMSKDTRNYTQKFNCLIRKVTCGADSLLYGGNTSIVKPNSFKNLAGLAYKFNTLKFEFAAPFFDHEEKTLYSYQLVGYDKEWSSWSRDFKKEYTNLQEGTYTFRVKAINIYDVESETGLYQFKIFPPWQRTWWAYTLYLLMAAGAVYLTVKFYTRRLVAQKEQLEQIVKERTEELVQQKEEISATLEIVNYQKEEIQNQAEELKATNEKLIELDEFKENMTGMIVHDLKNPLNSILSAANNEETKQAANQMLIMILNILDVQKFEDAKMKIHKVEFSLNDCVLEAMRHVKYLSGRKSIIMESCISGETTVKGDYELINRIFDNLLTNAIKYTPNNGKISLRQSDVENPAGFLRIEVTDTGQGIPADKIHLVFEKFGQIEAKKSGGIRSTGLGLMFCKLTVEAHGGQIGVVSEVEKGTTFWFLLPQSGKRFEAGSQLNQSEKENQSGKIQFDDQEKAYLLPFTNLLAGFSVYEFSDVKNTIQKIDSLNNPKIEKWKSAVMNAMKVGNEKIYAELIKL
jgi:signal transduction histidine kinase/ligand-binding sensor domain-containing protein